MKSRSTAKLKVVKTPAKAKASTPEIDVTAVVKNIMQWQKTRNFCITSQSRCDRSIEAFICSFLNYSNDEDETSRKAKFKEAQEIRLVVEKTKALPSAYKNNASLASCIVPVLHSADARKGWDVHRENVVTLMRAAAQSLPVYSWVNGVKGFSDLGLAVILGETGNLSNYATVSRVWKRLGLAVIDGEAQRKKTDKEAAARHGFKPKRRAQVWAICSDSMFKHQWRGKKEDVDAHAIGPYGEVYAKRKLATLGREGWSDKRRDSDARRIMTKALLADLWYQWNKLEGTLPVQEEFQQAA